jgi:2'-5' RNA ligase
METPSYAVIAYLPGALGRFVDELRKRLNPNYASWLAHVTWLTPRPLSLPPPEIVALLRGHCAHKEPFDVAIGGVSTFWPANGVVYLEFSSGAEQLRELHHSANTGPLSHAEPFPYVPHVTIAQDLDEAATRRAFDEASQEWRRYQGPASFRIESFFLVQQVSKTRWRNLAPIPLSSFFYASRS